MIPPYYPLMTTRGLVKLFVMWEEFRKGSELSRGPYVDMTYVVNDWADGDAVVNALMGGGAGFPPSTCPVSTNLVCNAAAVEGRGEVVDYLGGMPRFNLTVVKASYGLRPWDGSAGDSLPNSDNPGSPYPLATQSLDFSQEIIKLPEGSQKFESDNRPLNVPAITTVGVVRLVFVRKFVSGLNWVLIKSKVNKLNDALFFDAPKGHIKFSGAQTHKEYVSDGTSVQEVTLHFEYRDQEWNKYMRDDNGTWDYVKNSAGKRVLGYADLRPLLFDAPP